MITINTRALAATEHQPTRIKATADSGETTTRPYPQGKDVPDAHREVAEHIAAQVYGKDAPFTVRKVQETSSGYRFRAYMEPDDERAAREMAGTVWNDLHTYARVVDVSAGSRALLFHYASRDVRLTMDNAGRVLATEIVAGPDTGRTWTGGTPEEAVKALVRALYGKRCAHDYGTGRDSCPGCDSTQEQFEQRHAGHLRHMGATSFA